MSKLFWQILKSTPAVALSSAVIASGSAFAQTVTGEQVQTPNVNEMLQQVDQYNQQDSSLDQVNSVTQFRDVEPTDWAYEALRGLVERYGCIAGYPNGTYRGNRALTRYEFAAGLFACLQQIERLIAAEGDGSGGIDAGELATLERLVAEFEAELATLGTRVDNLEARLGEVEENQFSTTTKLKGEVIFALADAFGDNSTNPLGTNADDANTTLSYRARIAFDTSFTGRDRLRTRLETGNSPEYDVVTGTRSARLGFEAADGNNIEIGDLNYRFPIGNRIRAHVGLVGWEFEDMASVVNPYFDSSGSGALSRFARRNPAVYRTGASGAGVGANIGITDSIGLDVAYLVDDGSGNDPDIGFVGEDASFEVGGQLNLDLVDSLELGLTYFYSFYNEGQDINLTGSTASANNPFTTPGASVTANRYGVQANFELGDRISVGGWYGLIEAEEPASGDEATLQTWAANVAFLDLGKEGSVLGATFGQVPTVTDSDGLLFNTADGLQDSQDSSYLLEVQYRYPLTDDILLTPGAYAIFSPNGNEDNDTVYVGVLRTTFKF